MLWEQNNGFLRAAGALALMAALSACDSGSSNKDSYNNPGPGPGPGPTTPKPEPTPLTTSITSLGGTYVADGLVTVLTHDTTYNTFSADNQELDGRTLYVFDNDPVGRSTCVSSTCVTNWPPFLANEDSVATPPLSLIERDATSQQWALNGKPLYFFHADAAAGDVKGEGVGGVWHAALLEPALQKSGDASIGVHWSARGEVLTTTPDPSGQNLVFAAGLQDKAGFSLYTFTNDTAGVSNCTGNCLINWPALLAHPGETAEPPFSIIERKLGDNGGTARQWAYQGAPLYFFINDTAAGETKGAAIANFALARPLPWRVATTGHGSAFVAAGLASFAQPDSNGNVITSAGAKHGFALYTFDNDTAGVSNCNGACLTNWPALVAQPGATPRGPFTIITRSDSTTQWALNGKPLYFFNADAAPGDIEGDDVNNVWHLARVPPVSVDLHATEGTIFVAGSNLVDATGAAEPSRAKFTLYTFAMDTAGVPTCFAACATNWLPLYAPSVARNFGDFSVTTRDDPNTPDDDAGNIKQWAYKGKPLYFFAGDTQPGDINGESANWPVAVP
jgi:predicted lipoprotein with Yx(FWY)xxD motif